MVSARQSDGQQSAGNAIDFSIEFGPRQADSRLWEDDRVAVGKPPRRLPQRRPDGQTFDPRFMFREQVVRSPRRIQSRRYDALPAARHVEVSQIRE